MYCSSKRFGVSSGFAYWIQRSTGKIDVRYLPARIRHQDFLTRKTGAVQNSNLPTEPILLDRQHLELLTATISEEVPLPTLQIALQCIGETQYRKTTVRLYWRAPKKYNGQVSNRPAQRKALRFHGRILRMNRENIATLVFCFIQSTVSFFQQRISCLIRF